MPTYIHSQSFTLGMHYNVYLGAFLSIASIHAIILLSKYLKVKKISSPNVIVIVALIISLFIARKITHPPLLLVTNPVFWREWNTKAEIFRQIKLIPETGTVMSQNNMLPHLIQRKDKIYLLSLGYKKICPKYIMFDLSPGQNVNNYYSGEITDVSKVEILKNLLLNDPTYDRVATTYKNLFLFKRN